MGEYVNGQWVENGQSNYSGVQGLSTTNVPYYAPGATTPSRPPSGGVSDAKLDFVTPTWHARAATEDANSWGLGKNMNTLNLGLNGIGQLGSLYLGLQQLGLAKDSFKFQKQAFNKNLANQTSAYNTQVRDRVSGRNYATEEDRKAAEAAALLPG